MIPLNLSYKSAKTKPNKGGKWATVREVSQMST